MRPVTLEQASWVEANYSIFFVAEGTDAGLVGSAHLPPGG